MALPRVRLALPLLLALLGSRCVSDFVSAPEQPDIEGRRGSVVLQPAALALAGAGTTGRMSAQPVDFNGFALTGQRVTWQSLNPAVAVVDSASGAVTAVASGQAIIRASTPSLTGYAVVTVSAAGLPSALALGVTGTGTAEQLTAVWGTSDTLAFAVGTGGAVLRFDGSAWHTVATGTVQHLAGVWGASPRDVFVVGDSGTVQRYDGGGWQRLIAGTTAALSDVWGASPRDVFVVGSGGTVVRYDGNRNRWTRMPIPTDRNLRGIWGTSASDVYAVGDEGMVLHYDGREWVTEPTGTGALLLDVWGSGPNDVFAVGVGGTVLRRDPSSRTWTRQQTGTQSPLTGVWGTSRSDVYAVGANGTMLRHEGGQWVAVPGGIATDITGVWGTSTGSLHVVGAGGLSLTSGRAAAPRLLFSSIPATVTAGQTFRVGIRIVDAAGLPVQGADTVHVRLVDGPPGAALAGTTSAVTSDAVAVFDLALERAAIGYAIEASTTRLPAARSPSIAVNPGPISQVRFLSQPGTAETDSLIRPPVRVALTDAFGNTQRGLGPPVTLRMGPNATGANLSGTLTRRPVSGIATFDDLRVDRPGTDYTLVAAASAGPTVLSDTFVVVGGGAPAVIGIEPPSASLPVAAQSQFTASVYDAQGNPKPNEILVWAPAGLVPGVVNRNVFQVGSSTVSSDTGTTTTITGGRSGQGLLTATGSSGIVGYAVVTVSDPTVPPVVSWFIDPSPTLNTLYDVSRLEAVGASGTWLRRGGPSAPWQVQPTGTSEDLRSVWGGEPSGGSVYALTAGGALLRVQSAVVSEVARATSLSGRAAWGAAPREVFVAGAAGSGGNLLRYDGTALAGVPLPLGPTDSITAMYGFARDTLVLVLAGGRLHVAGREVACASVPLYDVWGTASNDLFVVGANGTILRYDGVACHAMPTPQAAVGRRIYGVSGTSPSNVYAVGEQGLILRFDGASWQSMVSPTGATLRAVFAGGWIASFGGGQQGNEAYVWAVGDNGTILRGQQARQP